MKFIEVDHREHRILAVWESAIDVYRAMLRAEWQSRGRTAVYPTSHEVDMAAQTIGGHHVSAICFGHDGHRCGPL